MFSSVATVFGPSTTFENRLPGNDNFILLISKPVRLLCGKKILFTGNSSNKPSYLYYDLCNIILLL